MENPGIKLCFHYYFISIDGYIYFIFLVLSLTRNNSIPVWKNYCMMTL